MPESSSPMVPNTPVKIQELTVPRDCQTWDWTGLPALALCIMCLSRSVSASQHPASPQTAALAFTHITVVDVTNGDRRPGQTVLIMGHHIQAVGPGPSVRLPAGTHVINARGKYLIPGLWDMHVHLQDYTDIAFPIFIANGVTGVRDAGSKVPLVMLRRWKREIAAGTRVGPRYLVSGPAIDQAPDTQQVITFGPAKQGRFGFDETHHIRVPLGLAAHAVDSLKAAGADFIKTYEISPTMYFAVAAEARRIGIPFGGHVGGIYSKLSGLTASDSGATFLDHYTWFKPRVCELYLIPAEAPDTNFAACTAAAARLQRNNSWVTVMNSLDTPRDRAIHARRYRLASVYQPSDTVLTEAQRATPEPTSTVAWTDYLRTHEDVRTEQHRLLLSVLHAAGIPMVVGTDANVYIPTLGIPGFSVHNTLLNFVVSGGLTPLEALQAATLNPALALRATDSLGTVAAGKVADVVLLDADPLADIWNTRRIRAVVADGRYYDRASLDHLLVQAEQVAAQR